MSKPFSVRTEPWTSFDKQSYWVFTDDFVHNKLLTVKMNVKSAKGTVNLKNSLVRKTEALKTEGEIKLWFPIWNTRGGSLYFRSKNNQIKVQYDDGLKGISSGQFNTYNLYASYQSEKTLKNIVLKAGANLLAKNFNLDNRVRIGFSDAGQTDVSTGHKFGYAKDNWSFDAYEVFSFKTKALINNAIRVGYHNGAHDFFLRAENQTDRFFKGLDFTNLDTYFTKFIFDAIRRVDDLTVVGVEAEFTKKGFTKGAFVIQRSIPTREVGVKLKLSSDRSAAVCYQAVLKNYGKWTAGWGVSDLGKGNKSQFGLQVDVNL